MNQITSTKGIIYSLSMCVYVLLYCYIYIKREREPKKHFRTDTIHIKTHNFLHVYIHMYNIYILTWSGQLPKFIKIWSWSPISLLGQPCGVADSEMGRSKRNPLDPVRVNSMMMMMMMIIFWRSMGQNLWIPWFRNLVSDGLQRIPWLLTYPRMIPPTCDNLQ